MLNAALRDLQWRRRRFVIAVFGTGLVFAMTLVLTGLSNGFHVEAQRSVDSLGVDVFMIKTGASGPFLGSVPFPAVEARPVSKLPGVTEAVPLVYGSVSTSEGGSTRNVNVFGAPQNGPGMPVMIAGQDPAKPDEVAVSSTMGKNVDDEVELGGRKLRVVGIVDDSTALAGQANVFLTVPGAQRLLFGGQPLISSIGVRAITRAGSRRLPRGGPRRRRQRPATGADKRRGRSR